jgi:hypothetical protein
MSKKQRWLSLAATLLAVGGWMGCDRERPSAPATAPRTADQPQGTSMGAQPGASDMATAGGAGAAADGGGSTDTAAPIGAGQMPGQQPQDGGQADGGPSTERR